MKKTYANENKKKKPINEHFDNIIFWR